MADPSPTPSVLAITGEPGEGKTTALRELAGALEERGWPVGGVVQVAFGPPHERAGYRLLDLETGDGFPFAHRRQHRAPGELAFAFDPTGWDWARARILAARRRRSVVLVDEMGRLEARGRGHLPALLAPLSPERSRLWVLGLRREVRAPIEDRLGPFRDALPVPRSREQQLHLMERALGRLGP